MEWETLLAEIQNPPTVNSPVLESAFHRTHPEDFDVEEIPAYLPDGTGEHIYLWVEKRDVAAGDLISHLSRTLKVNSRDIGVAGQKDRRAVTRQFVSVPKRCLPLIAEVDGKGVKVLSISAHNNKLRTGHLEGNHFRIHLRPTDEHTFTDDDAANVFVRLQQLETLGFPNYFGTQRFGHDGNSIKDGIGLLTGQLSAKRWSHHKRRFMTKMVSSAIQSAVFNLVLAERLGRAEPTAFVTGDVVCRKDGIRPHLLAETAETDISQLVAMGPMPGPKMVKATDEALALETAALVRLGLTAEQFEDSGKLTPGTRRKMFEYPHNVSATLSEDAAIIVEFSLSSGSFATVLLAEVVSVLR